MDKKKNVILSKMKSLDFISILVAYVIIITVFATASPYFLSVRNFFNIVQYAAIVGVMATSYTLLMICGEIDISVGSVVALAGMVLGMLTPEDPTNVGGLLVAIVACVLTGGVCCGINGLLVTKIKIPAFVATMATMNIYRGIAYIISNGKSITILNKSLTNIGRGDMMGIPNTIIILAIATVIFWFIAKYTVFGRRLFIIGGNSDSAHLSGIKVKPSVLKIFIINGIMVGIASLMTTSQLGAAMPQGSNGLEFDVISGIVLGGTSMSGGKGSIIGSLVGVLLLATLNNGMTMMEISSYWQLVVKGGVLLLAIVIDILKNNGKAK